MPNEFKYKAEYWVKDGDSRCYPLRDELKGWGCKWNPEFKCWKLPNSNPGSLAHRAIKSFGLILELDASTRVFE